MISFIKTSAHHSIKLSLGFALLVGASLWFAPKPMIIGRMEALMEASDPVITDYQKFKKTFNEGEVLAVTFRPAELFTKDGIEGLRQLTSKLEAISGVTGVTSLTSVSLPNVVGEGVEFKKLIPDEDPNDLTPEVLKEIKDKSLATASLVDRFISHDGQTAIVVAETKLGLDLAERRSAFEKAKAEVISLRTDSTELHLIGTEYIDAEIESLLKSDWIRYGIVVVLLTGVGLILSFGSMSLALVGVAQAVTVTSLVMSAFAFFGGTLDVVTAVIPALTLALSLAAVTPILTQFQHSLLGLGSVHEAIQASFLVKRSNLVFCFLATAGTCLSMLATTLPALRSLAVWGLVALVINALCLCFQLPALLAICAKVTPAKGVETIRKTIVLHWTKTAYQSVHLRHIVTGVLAALACTSALGISKLHFETNPTSFLSFHNPLKQEINYFDKTAGGPLTIDILVKAKNGGANFSVKDPVNKLKDVQNSMVKEFPRDFSGSLSIADYYKELHRAFTPGAENGDGMPQTDADFSNYTDLLELSDGKVLGKLLTIDKQSARVLLSRHLGSWSSPSAIAAYVENTLPNILGDQLTATIAGFGAICVRLDKLVFESMWSSFGVAFITLALLLALVSRSLLVALTCVFSTVIALGAVFGIIGLVGKPIDVCMAPLSGLGVIIGGLIGIPFFLRYQLSGLSHGDTRFTKLRRACIESIPEVISLTLICALAMGSLVFSGLRTIGALGIWSALLACVATITQTLVLPALLSYFCKEDAALMEIGETHESPKSAA